MFENTQADDADVTITCPKNALFYVIQGNEAAMAQAIQVQGDASLLSMLAQSMNQFPTQGIMPFNIVEP